VTSRATEFRFALLAFGLLAVLFIAWPQIDLAASGLFYRGEGRWVLERTSRWLFLPYHGLPRLGQGLIIILPILWALSFVRRFPALKARRAIFGFLLIGGLLGPVLLVDATLKEHSGRARPVRVEQFGGALQFTPAFVVADQCENNCSFVSGHVATAAFIMAFGWLGSPAVRRRWLLASIGFGAFMALTRMAPGGHFLSDTIFAWFATYFTLWLTEWLFRRLGWLP
jgi:membrane-associated PAP2 superfamily phosphatase